jgi:tetratricopeptide (TPR) repeat protein
MLKDAVSLFQQAIDKDPSYAAAYAEMAQAYFLLGAFHYLPVEEANLKAIAAAKRAVDLDETLAEAHVALGVALGGAWNFAGEVSEYQRAIEQNPNLSEAHVNYGAYLSGRGRFDDGVRELTLAHELDPLSMTPINLLGVNYYFQRDYDKSLEQWSKSLAINSSSAIAYFNLFHVYVGKKSYDKAIASLQEPVVFDRFGLYEVPGNPEPQTILYCEKDRFQCTQTGHCPLPSSPENFCRLAEVPPLTGNFSDPHCETAGTMGIFAKGKVRFLRWGRLTGPWALPTQTIRLDGTT